MDTKQEFIDKVESAWNELVEVLAQCKDSQMALPGVTGFWSAKDILAHITWFERQMIGVLQQRALVGSEWWNLPVDERNRKIYESNKDRALDEVRAQFFQTHKDLWVLLQDLKEEELTSASKFREMPPDWAPVDMLTGNTHKHYREHAQSLCVWYASRQDSH